MSNPSIVILSKTLAIGGAEKQALTLAKKLTQSNIKSILVVWHGSKIDTRYLKFIELHSIRYVSLHGSTIKKFIHFNQIIKDEKISLVLSYLSLANIIAGLCKLIHRNLLSIGGIRTEKLPFHKLIFERFVHNYLNDATVFNNYSAREKFSKRGFNLEKIFVIHNAVDVIDTSKRNKSIDELVFVSVSRFVELKDFPTALYAFKKTVQNNPDKKLIYQIVGYGPLEKKIRSLVTELDLQNNVELIINPPNIIEIIRNSDIYLSTSLYEGLSNSIMEAMSAGLPIIATNVGDNSFLVRNSFNGFIVPCKEITLISEKMEVLVNDVSLRREFGRKSRIKVEEEFSESKLLEHYLELFSEMRLI